MKKKKKHTETLLANKASSYITQTADVRIIRCYQGLDNVDFDKTMFEVCHKPTPGTDMTFAYFHLKPYVFVSGDGAVTAGIEVK